MTADKAAFLDLRDDPIRSDNSACKADYPTELRKMAALVERAGLPHAAEMLRGAAAEIDRLCAIAKAKEKSR